MLRGEKAGARLASDFAGQWLQIRAISRDMHFDPIAFPGFDEDLRTAMLRETELF